jgi:mono/diheme cytochrome c family protein
MRGSISGHRLLVLAGVLTLFVAGCARAPLRDPAAPYYGEALYRAHCAACHGISGAGGGPSAESLIVAPPDLRHIRRRNGGSYPLRRVERIIEGREPVSSHVRRGMPLWGDLLLEPRDGYQVKTMKKKVAHLARYLASIQDDAG